MEISSERLSGGSLRGNYIKENYDLGSNKVTAWLPILSGYRSRKQMLDNISGASVKQDVTRYINHFTDMLLRDALPYSSGGLKEIKNGDLLVCSGRFGSAALSRDSSPRSDGAGLELIRFHELRPGVTINNQDNFYMTSTIEGNYSDFEYGSIPVQRSGSNTGELFDFLFSETPGCEMRYDSDMLMDKIRDMSNMWPTAKRVGYKYPSIEEWLSDRKTTTEFLRGIVQVQEVRESSDSRKRYDILASPVSMWHCDKVYDL